MRAFVNVECDTFFFSIDLTAPLGVTFGPIQVLDVTVSVAAEGADVTIRLSVRGRQMPKTTGLAFIRHHRTSVFTSDIACMFRRFGLLLVRVKGLAMTADA